MKKGLPAFKNIPPCPPKKEWTRYRFKTKSIEDYRPLIFNPKYPWWCSGENDEDVTIIAFLPMNEDLKIYWDDAFNIESSNHENIFFTDRFSKPDYFED